MIFLKDMEFLKCSLLTTDIERYFETINSKKKPDTESLSHLGYFSGFQFKEYGNIKIGAEIDYFEYYEDEIRHFLEFVIMCSLIFSSSMRL